MSWDLRDSTPLAHGPDTQASSPTPEPASPDLVPTVAMLLTDEAWLDDPLGLDTFPAQDRDLLRQYGLVPPGHWQALRRLMCRDVVEMS